MVQISSYFLALKVDTDVSLLFQRGCSWPSWKGVAVDGRGGWRRALIGLLLLRGGVVGGAGCCSLLCSETIKWTVISPGRLHVSFHQHLHTLHSNKWLGWILQSCEDWCITDKWFTVNTLTFCNKAELGPQWECAEHILDHKGKMDDNRCDPSNNSEVRKNWHSTNCENKYPHPPAESMQFGRRPVHLFHIWECVKLQFV